MKHNNSILGIGIILVLMPFLGFPAPWKSFLVFFLGLLLCALVISGRFVARQGKKPLRAKEKFASSAVPFIENQSNVGSSENRSSVHNHEQSPQS